MERSSFSNSDDISKLCEALSLTEEEEHAAVLDRSMRLDGEESMKLCLMGRFVANKLLNIEAVKNTLPKIWKTNLDFEIKALQRNTFAFLFKCQEDRKRIIAGGPWHFDNYVLVLEEPSKFGEVPNSNFRFVEFWVQLHNVPLCCMVKKTAVFLGEQIGKVVAFDEDENRNKEGHFIRLRVVVDITKPLKRFLKIDLSGEGDTRLLLIKYERLPDFCFRCGKMGHGERECTAENSLSLQSNKPYGPWLRAMSPQKRQSSWIKREGSYGKEKNSTPMEKNIGRKEGINMTSWKNKAGQTIPTPSTKDGLTVTGESATGERGSERAGVETTTDIQYGALNKGESPQDQHEQVWSHVGKGKQVSEDATNKSGIHPIKAKNGMEIAAAAMDPNAIKLTGFGEEQSRDKDKEGEDKKNNPICQMQLKQTGQSQGGPHLVGPSPKNSWKRKARASKMQMGEVQMKDMGGKRGLAEDSVEGQRDPKKHKGVSDEKQNTETKSEMAGVGSSEACRPQ